MEKKKPVAKPMTSENHGNWECYGQEADGCPCKRCNAYRKTSLQEPTYLQWFHNLEGRAYDFDYVFPDFKNSKILSAVQPFDPFNYEPHFQSIPDIVKSVTVPKPIWSVPTKNFHEWAFFAVTGGRFRASKNKDVWVLWNHKKKAITRKTVMGLQDRKNTNALWHKIPLPDNEDPKHPNIFYQIADATQELCDEYLRWFSKNCTNGGPPNETNHRYMQFVNCNNMPSVKAFVNNIRKDFEHKRYHWQPSRQKLGGNQGYGDLPKSERVSIKCIHKMMQKYHQWLPAIKKTKTTPIDSFLT